MTIGIIHPSILWVSILTRLNLLSIHVLRWTVLPRVIDCQCLYPFYMFEYDLVSQKFAYSWLLLKHLLSCQKPPSLRQHNKDIEAKYCSLAVAFAKNEVRLFGMRFPSLSEIPFLCCYGQTYEPVNCKAAVMSSSYEGRTWGQAVGQRYICNLSLHFWAPFARLLPLGCVAYSHCSIHMPQPELARRSAAPQLLAVAYLHGKAYKDLDQEQYGSFLDHSRMQIWG